MSAIVALYIIVLDKVGTCIEKNAFDKTLKFSKKSKFMRKGCESK